MFSNLLTNSAKYTERGGKIRLTARLTGAEVVVTVSDNGIGIPAKDIDALFERYYRGSNVSGIVGTGVGLYLVKMVVEVHGGQIAVESTEGKGSRFTIRLPVTAKPQPSLPAPKPAELIGTMTDDR